MLISCRLHQYHLTSLVTRKGGTVTTLLRHCVLKFAYSLVYCIWLSNRLPSLTLLVRCGPWCICFKICLLFSSIWLSNRLPSLTLLVRGGPWCICCVYSTSSKSSMGCAASSKSTSDLCVSQFFFFSFLVQVKHL